MRVIGPSPVGVELAYAELTSTDTTTNATFTDGALAANKIPGLSCTVVGIGRPVEIEFFCTSAWHSVANTNADVVLLTNNAQGLTTTIAQAKTPNTTDGQSVGFVRRIVLTAGTSYTFECGKVLGGAGTGTWKAAANFPMFLSVTQR